MVKGYIANVKKRKVNWALVASTTALEKADLSKRLLLRLLNPKSNDDATASSLNHSTCTSQREGINACNIGAMVKTNGMTIRRGSTPLDFRFSNLCPYGVSSSNLNLV